MAGTEGGAWQTIKKWQNTVKNGEKGVGFAAPERASF